MSNPIRRFRYWLISMLAGSDVVAVNVTIRNGGFYLVESGGFFCNCQVYGADDGISHGGL